MYIKISKQSQLVLLRNMNSYLGDYKIPREVLHEIGNILEFEKSNDKDYIALFIKPVKNDTTDILDELQVYPTEMELPDNNFCNIKIKGKKHPMKRKRIWSWFDIVVEKDKRRIFVIYSINKKHLHRKGGF